MANGNVVEAPYCPKVTAETTNTPLFPKRKFDTLPPEMVCATTEYLDLESFCSLRKASGIVAQKSESVFFRKFRISKTLPLTSASFSQLQNMIGSSELGSVMKKLEYLTFVANAHHMDDLVDTLGAIGVECPLSSDNTTFFHDCQQYGADKVAELIFDKLPKLRSINFVHETYDHATEKGSVDIPRDQAPCWIYENVAELVTPLMTNPERYAPLGCWMIGFLLEAISKSSLKLDALSLAHFFPLRPNILTNDIPQSQPYHQPFQHLKTLEIRLRDLKHTRSGTVTATVFDQMRNSWHIPAIAAAATNLRTLHLSCSAFGDQGDFMRQWARGMDAPHLEELHLDKIDIDHATLRSILRRSPNVHHLAVTEVALYGGSWAAALAELRDRPQQQQQQQQQQLADLPLLPALRSLAFNLCADGPGGPGGGGGSHRYLHVHWEDYDEPRKTGLTRKPWHNGLVVAEGPRSEIMARQRIDSGWSFPALQKEVPLQEALERLIAGLCDCDLGSL